MFDFLDQMGGAYWERVRLLMNTWVEDYPDAEREALIARLKLRQGEHVRAAFWELYLFNVLRGLGADITCHPSVPGTDHRPDFLVEALGEPFYLEAKVLEDEREMAVRSQLRDSVWQALNQRLQSDKCFVRVGIERYGFKPLPAKRFAAEVGDWLRRIEFDDSPETWPTCTWEDRTTGWDIEVSAIRKGRHSPSDRIVGLGSAEAMVWDDRPAVRRALEKKYRHYGTDPGLPLVVALGVNRFTIDDDAVFDSLLGDQVLVFSRDRPDEANLDRKRNGLWWGGRGPSAQRLSAVIVSRAVQPPGVVRDPGKLWVNPWSSRPLQVRLPHLPTYEPVNGQFVLRPSERSVAEVLNLPLEWPGPEPDFDRT